MKTTKKGFTLLELLIVIAILAILASAAVVVLNPAELLRRARDSGRITNIANIRNAINLYLTTVTTIDLDVQAGCMDTTPTSKTFTSLLTGYSGTLATTTISTCVFSHYDRDCCCARNGRVWLDSDQFRSDCRWFSALRSSP